MGDLFGGLSGIGSGIGSLFEASSLKASAGDLDKASYLERQNAKISRASTGIQIAAIDRDLLRSTGGQQSDVAVAGFQASGSALDLARDTAQQGALAEAMTTAQGAIDFQGHVLQAESYAAQAASARRQSSASMFGGIMQIALGVFSMFSDKRLKENIVRVGTTPAGLPIVKYNYQNDKTEWIGFLAQDVEKIDPGAVRDMGMKMIDSKYAPERVNG